MLDQAQFERGSRTCVTVEVVHDLQYGGIAEPFERFRAVYTVRFAKAVYVLHAFQKKSRHGVGTPKTELDLIDERLKRARVRCRR
jgi:phage-related protein